VETAVVGIVGALIGILVTNAIRLYLDWRLRQERVRDIQTALRAEIRSQRHTLEQYGDAERSEAVVDEILSTGGFTPFLAQFVGSFVFEAVIRDVHVLPGPVIDPVVLYHRQVRSMTALIDDMRSPGFPGLSADRKAAIFADYTALGSYALELSDRAVIALNASLKDDDER
jgi:hypothetical protein